MTEIVVSALYKFATLDNFELLRKPILELMEKHQVKGTLLLAKEGINGTIAGDRKGIDALLAWLRSDPRLADIDTKESYEQAQDWNALISDPDVMLIDTRNDYEVQIGGFKNAINPVTDTFREFPQYVKDNLDPNKHKKVAMYCTGGIRCEKSTAYLKEQGFNEVFHLQGGVLKYLEEIPADESLWEGECFVFDNRVAVNHDLEKGQYDQCYACRYPITEEEKNSPQFEQGVSCPHCYDKVSDRQRQRFSEREKQVKLAKERGEEHIGSVANKISIQRRALKYQVKEQHREKLQTLKSK